jgi:hypothetical protein
MHILNQMDPKLHAEVRRRRAEVGTDLMQALEDAWTFWLARRWKSEASVSVDEILADLAYGRD